MTPRADRSESAGRAVSVQAMARKRQVILGLTATLIYLGVFLALFWKFGGEACEVFLYGSSLIATLIGCAWERRSRPH